MYDTIIIGSGPAGLSAAVYGKRANLNILVIEKEYEGTGQVAESGRVDNYPGFQGISGYELGEKLRAHAVNAGTDFAEGKVMELQKEPAGSWQVRLEDGSSYTGKTIVYAAGAAHRHLNIPGETEFSGRGVSYCAICDGAFYHGKTVAVIGGGDTALDEALYLSEICKKVYLIHRRKQFRGALSTVKLAEEKPNIEFVLDAVPVQISGEEKADEIQLQDGRHLKVDGFFVAIGMEPNSSLLKGLVKLDEHGYVEAGETGKTSAEGIFAAGDVRTKELRQIVTAVSDGANAMTSAAGYIRGR